MLALENAQPLLDWVNERHAIYMRKAYLINREQDRNDPVMSGVGVRMSSRMKAAWGHEEPDPKNPKAWTLDRLTDDPILRQYRFCNVFRELDRVTVWIRENIREPFADHEHLWFMLAAARYINWPETLEELMSLGHRYMEYIPSWPSQNDFAPTALTEALSRRRARGEKVETGAYMIRAESDRKAPWYDWSKQRYVAEVVLGKLWARRDYISTFLSPGAAAVHMEDVWNILQDKHYTGWGPFMAYQWVVDLRWTRYLRDAPDINTWAAVGPGSRRGLNRLHGRPVDAPLRQEQAVEEMVELRELMAQPGALASWVQLPDLSDVQNALCETDKYLRVKNGEGRPRAMYVPGRGW